MTEAEIEEHSCTIGEKEIGGNDMMNNSAVDHRTSARDMEDERRSEDEDLTKKSPGLEMRKDLPTADENENILVPIDGVPLSPDRNFLF